MDDRQPDLWAATLTTWIAALIAFILRLAARWVKKVPLNWGDYIAVLAFLFTTVFSVLGLYKIHFGFGRHLTDLGLKDDLNSFNIVAPDFFRLLWIDMWIYTAAMGFSKIAALALYLRIFGQSNIRMPILILLGCVGCWMIARIVTIPLLCRPTRKFWHSEIPGTCPVKTDNFFAGTTIPHILMEIAIVALPIIKVRQLNLPRAQKIAVGGMFASGILVCAASIVQLVQSFELDPTSLDLWWTSAPQTIASIIEINLGHFSTSLPNLRPILDIAIGRRSINDSRRTPYYEQTTIKSSRSKKVTGFTHLSSGQSRTDSEVELAQYEDTVVGNGGKPMQQGIWKSTTTDVSSTKRDST